MIGIGCRFPGGADSPDTFWDLLLAGVETSSDIPGDRWRSYAELGHRHASVLRDTVGRGNFLSGIDGFDADFFGITPREAELMDPQQRILLEVAWQALEHAGVPPYSLAGSETGVFVGSCTDDYRRHLLEDIVNMDAWSGIGAARCAVANRLSHVLDLRGPSLAVDTACSASLVALHLACQSLRSAESGLALVAGVNLLVSPGETVTLNLAGALAADGRSKAFDATADGYGRGEGCGVLVLKRLSDAQRDGDRVLALVRGSAVSQDGYTSGIMAPNPVAQEHVMVRACRDAGVDPRTVGFVEAHGTGTLLGDPLEAEAISAVYGVDRADDGCFIGSVKANIGHLEGAAGVAGVIKAVLALGKAEIPATPMASGPNPAVPWHANGLRLVTERVPWPSAGEPRRAGVSGFGYGGTVAHIVLEEPPGTPATHQADGRGERLFALSAASEEALGRRAGDLADWLSKQGDEISLDSLAHTLALRRSHLGHRAAVTASDRSELIGRLYELVQDESADHVVTGSPLPERETGLVWVFSGHGSQWTGMGRELLATSPVFAAVLDELAPVFANEIGFTPRQVLEDGALDDVCRIQSMIFAMQVGLAAVWRDRGLVPAAVIGHSVGEIAAAVCAGALDLEAGAKLSCRRSRVLRREAGKGAMAMVGLPFAEVERRLAGRPGIVAGIQSSPVSTVVSGEPAAVEAAIREFQAAGLVVRRVASDVAFHSPRMDPLATELAEAVAELRPTQTKIPLYTTALPDPRALPVFDGTYWAANLRNPVRLAGAVAAAAEDGHLAFLEISPHPVVTHSISETLSHQGIEECFVGGTLRRDQSEERSLLTALGSLYCHGLEVDWSRLYPDGELVAAPANPWRHRSLWWRPQLGGGGSARAHDPHSQTLLGAETPVAGSAVRMWQSDLDDGNRPYPGSHSINGVEIVPAAVFLTTFFAAAAPGSPPPTLRKIVMRSPLMTAELRNIQVVLDGDTLRIASRAAATGSGRGWDIHTYATVAEPGELPGPHTPDVPVEPVPPTLVHDRLSAVGVPSTGFDWTVRELLRGSGALRGTVALGRSTTWAPLLDAVMTLAPVAYPGDPVLRMAVEVDEVTVQGEPPESAVIDIAMRADAPTTVDVTVTTHEGLVIAHLSGLRYATIGAEDAVSTDPRTLVHEIVWRPYEPLVDPSSDRALIVVGPHDELAEQLVAQARATGRDCRLFGDSEQVDGLAGADVCLILPTTTSDEAEDFLRSFATITSRQTGPGRLWCLTTGAAWTGTGTESPQRPAAAAVTGFGRTLAGTRPESWGAVIDLDDVAVTDAAGTAKTVLGLIGTASGEAVIAVRQGRPFVARATRVAGQPSHPAAPCRPEGTYLISGGLGRLGLAAADRLVGLGAKRLLFLTPEEFHPRSRWESAEEAEGLLALEGRGVTVRVLTADMTDPDRSGLPPVRGVLSITEPGGPGGRSRIRGTQFLHELFPPGTLDFFTVFSSCDQLLNKPGSELDGAACALLDAVVTQRAQAGEHAVGLDVVSGHDLTASVIVAAWDVADRRGPGVHSVFRDDRPELLERALPVLSELKAVADEPVETDELSALDPEQLLTTLTAEIRSLIAKEMKLAPADLAPTRSLADQGMDSILTVMVRRRLEKRFGCRLPSTLLWQTPTVSAIAEHVAELLDTSADPNPASPRGETSCA
ncbi:putative iterative type I polyketide synthase [Amycolatopsis decaplanina DSM 44594]|uniref:Putative iterative type I polyketide synthase n=1 Tax=Amycolatopsis decaplanina DSM 44594 TaxID=1284240 RepID=M2XTP4_9PSEU|nr:putative iterative type I polyketide synthase [Amycolatopsis decaplanina DSM 44594]